MEMLNSFPENLRGSRRHQAELAVFLLFANSAVDGIAVYGAVPPGGSQVDIVAWYVADVRAAVEIKGGEYIEVDGVWQRTADLGGESVDTQISQAFEAGMGLHHYLKRHEGEHSPFVVNVLVLPDMPAGHELERRNGQAIVLCGRDNLVERIRNAAVTRNKILFPPTWADARRESALLLARPPEPEQEPEPEPKPSAEPPNGADAEGIAALLGDHGVYIGRVEHLHLHLAERKGQIPYPDWVPGV